MQLCIVSGFGLRGEGKAETWSWSGPGNHTRVHYFSTKIIIDSMSYTKAKLIMTYYTPWDANYTEINNRITCLLPQQGPCARPAIAEKPELAIKFSIWTGKIFVINIPNETKRKQWNSKSGINTRILFALSICLSIISLYYTVHAQLKGRPMLNIPFCHPLWETGR